MLFYGKPVDHATEVELVRHTGVEQIINSPL